MCFTTRHICSCSGSLTAALASTLFPPAAWTVFFALETPGKRGAVAYWMALLATALPAMHRIASSRHLPTIILRKVTSALFSCEHRWDRQGN